MVCRLQEQEVGRPQGGVKIYLALTKTLALDEEEKKVVLLSSKYYVLAIWVWRGQDLAFELSEDWQIDFASYQWTKLDAKVNTNKTKL